MGTEIVVVSEPDVTLIVSEGAQGPVGTQGPIGVSGDVTTGLNISVDGELSLFSGTTGKLLKRATQTGLLKATNGVLSTASADTDYITPSSQNFTGPKIFSLLGTENILIDARTTHRSMTLGVLRIEHTAGISGTRPISLDIDANGYGDTHAIDTRYIATGLGAGSENHIFDAHVDTANSTGGEVAAFSVSKSGSGMVEVTAIETYAGVKLLKQQIGTKVPADSNFTFSGGVYTDNTVAFGSSITNVPIFVNNSDYIYLGHSVKFSVIDVLLNTVATGAGIIPTFEYSDGLNSWAVFNPGDNTNGFRQSGILSIPSLIGWVTRTVNGVVAKFWIRIRRTNAAVITPPTEESIISIIVSETYIWDELGNIHVSTANLKNLPTFSSVNNAITGGLVSGDVFRDTNGALFIV